MNEIKPKFVGAFLTAVAFLLISIFIMSETSYTQTYHRIKNRWKSDQYIHAQGTGIEVGTIKPDWWSAMWVIEPVAGTEFVRLKNRWKNDQYIHAEGPTIAVGTIKPGWWSAMWVIEPVVGTEFVRLKNRWKSDQYIHAQGPAIAVGTIKPGWWSAMWTLEPVGDTVSPPPPGDNSIDQYLLKLSYDPRALLAVKGDGSTVLQETEKGRTKDRKVGNNSVIICERITKDAERNFDEVAIFQPTRGIIWPGALIKADASLVDGLPVPITSLRRSPVKLNIDLPGMGSKGNIVVQNPDYGNVRAAIDGALEWWNNNAYREGYVNASRSSYKSATSYSNEQLAMSLGFNVKWLSGSAAGQFSHASNEEKYVSVVIFKQVFYTVTFSPPSTPATVFDNSVTLSQVKAVTNAQSPLAYVASIDYGRFVMFRMETSRQETEIDAKAALEYGTGTTRASGNLEAKYKKILANSTITVTTLGGNAEAASQAVSARGAGDLTPYLTGKNAVYSKSNPGEPIAYKVNFLKDHTLAKMGSTTQYTQTVCKEQQNGYIKFFHQGGYVAKFQVNWYENGQAKSWKSGDKTAGWANTIKFPGDATRFSIKAIAYTGLLWQPENEIMNLSSTSIPNKCYKVYGTTLSPAYNNNCN